MTLPSLSRAEHLHQFSQELDALASRCETEPPVSPELIEAIFAEHEAECAALEAAGREAEVQGSRVGRRA